MHRTTLALLLCAMAAAQDGWIRVERRGEAWTLVDAQGAPFFSTGVNHCHLFLYAKPYNKEATVARYGAGLMNAKGWFDVGSPAFAAFREAQVGHLRDWGFNTFGYHTDKPILDGVPDDIRFIASFPTMKSQIEYHQSKDLRPDPFEPAFAAAVEAAATPVIERYRARRNLIGYAWTDGFGGGLLMGWVQQMRGLPATAPAKQAWIDILRRAYPDAAAAAQAYRLAGSTTWEDLAAHTTWPYPNPGTADEIAFKQALIGQYYAVAAGICRRLDPNHLVLGDKLRKPTPDELAAIGPHVDVVLFEGYGFGDAGSATCAEMARASGKPVLFGDGGFGFRRPERIATGKGPHPDGGKGRQFASQDEAGRYFAQTLANLATSPVCLGWHFCGFLEEYDSPGLKMQDPNENGFMDPFEKPNDAFLAQVRPALQAAAVARAALLQTAAAR
jgi:hypothetical protein